MPVPPVADIPSYVDALYRQQSGRVLATLIRLLGSFEAAEEALQEAFSAALKQWPRDGIPEKPRAWLISTGRFKAIDRIRQQQRHQQLLRQNGDDARVTPALDLEETDYIEDDSLRLMFTCCHPALSEHARVALTLREICGLTTEAVASAFLTQPSTLAQRIVRAKRKIKDANIPYEVPQGAALTARLDAVLQVIYLVFNEGYSASTGNRLQRPDLMAEAIRLGRLVANLLDEPEVKGLLSLMLFQASRRRARTDHNGDLIRLHDQDRRLWDQGMINEADELVKVALASGRVGPYSLQAAIAGVHATAANAEATDWDEILGLYNVLLRIQDTPVIRLNRSVAIAKTRGVEAALAEIEQLMQSGDLDGYHLLHATRGHYLEQLKRDDDALSCYREALKNTQQSSEQQFLRQRIHHLLMNKNNC
ncbi:RNA polymerase subunit sigma-24 [Aliidiomarina sedimenti]|uniref:RNA polymerase subunit sigma-24 n=1 Tax=Aliidiomarina sedimenti TaxID=1933879 RepID=A0ABY0BXV6_9GAMM|nr:RNA polymerase sigma factor [Aliidiomarina sedimenti]RUO29262.1 RNA polymerase subunit sigma-24 [Aliidiomarina sedimenti]